MKTIIAIVLFSVCLQAQSYSPIILAQRPKKATLLNGTSQWWSKDSPDSAYIRGGSLMIMAFINPSTLSGDHQIVGLYKSATLGRSYMLYQSVNLVFLYVSADGNSNANRQSSINIASNKWQLITATYSPSAINIYIDGVLVNGAVAGVIPTSLYSPSGTPLTSGVNGTLSANFFNGMIGAVQVVRFASSLPSDIDNTIRNASASKKLPKSYTGGEFVLNVDWTNLGLDKSGKNNSLTPSGSPIIQNTKY